MSLNQILKAPKFNKMFSKNDITLNDSEIYDLVLDKKRKFRVHLRKKKLYETFRK